MKLKKFLLFLILGLALISFTSCTDKPGDTEYTITYNLDGGTMAVTSQVFKNYEDVELPIPTRAGYNFLGWYNYRDVKINSLYANRDYELTAKWAEKSYEEKEKVNVFLEQELITNIEITEDGLSFILDESLNNVDCTLIVTYGTKVGFYLDSADVFSLSKNIVFNEGLDNNYTNNISVRVYYEEEIVEQINCKYSKPQTFKISDCVTKDLNELEKTILTANNILYEVYFNLNTTTYKVSSNSKYYTTKRTTDYIYIIVKVTCVTGYTIFNDVDVYVNNKLVTKDYTINSTNTILTYTIDDPNWTGYH